MTERINILYLDDCHDKIATSFKEWEEWHGEAEICATMIDYRGVSRFHQKMQERAQKDGEDFRKCVGDKPFGYKTTIDYSGMEHAVSKAQYGKPQFIAHLDTWDKWLDKTKHLFTNAAIYLAFCEELSLYQKISCYIKSIENEAWAVEILRDRLMPDELNHPDAKSVFKKLHCYFKDEYSGGMIDFDI